MSKGYLALILHAHLPYVRHPEHEGFLEEDWLFEAISECYIPLLSRLQRILADGVRCRLTLSISPTLLEMLSDPLLRARYQIPGKPGGTICQRGSPDEKLHPG